MVDWFSKDIDNRAHRAFKKVKDDVEVLKIELEEIKNLDVSTTKHLSLTQIQKKYEKNYNILEIEIEKTQNIIEKELEVVNNKISKCCDDKELRENNLIRKVEKLEKELYKRDQYYGEKILRLQEVVFAESLDKTEKNLNLEENNTGKLNVVLAEEKNGFFKWLFNTEKKVDEIVEVRKK